MKTIWIAALCAALVSISSGAWAGGGAGGYVIDKGQSGGEPSWNTYLHQREMRERRQYDEQYRNLHGAILARQDALDRERHRSVPDVAEVNQLQHDLSQLRAELGHAENRFDRIKQEEAGRYNDYGYPRSR